jgi:hypothetical protein
LDITHLLIVFVEEISWLVQHFYIHVKLFFVVVCHLTLIPLHHLSGEIRLATFVFTPETSKWRGRSALRLKNSGEKFSSLGPAPHLEESIFASLFLNLITNANV